MVSPHDVVRQTLRELEQAWEQLDVIVDPEHWDVANARLTAAITSAETAIRDVKREQGYAVHSSGFLLPWLRPAVRGRRHFARAS